MHVEDGFTDHLAVWVSFRRHSWGWGGSYACVDGTVLGPYLGIVKRLQEQPYQCGGGVLSIPFLRCIGTIGLIFMNAVRKTGSYSVSYLQSFTCAARRNTWVDRLVIFMQ